MSAMSDHGVIDVPTVVPEATSSPVAGKEGTWVKALWVELRPSQWLKNLFVLAPVFFSQNLFAFDAVARCLAALACFCAVSSSVYLLNDLHDREQDRLHPHKRHRPLASGALKGWIAQATMIVLLIGALAASLRLGGSFTAVLAVYWLLNFAYTVRLKSVVILDVFVIASGYLLRVIGGAVAIRSRMSAWLLICTTLLALFIGLCKRRHEIVLLREGATGHRKVLDEYPLPFLDMMIGVITASIVVSYSLFTVSNEVVSKLPLPGLLLTAPFVLYGLFRYLYLVYHKVEGGDPTQSILTDSPMLVNLLLWTAATGILLYWVARR